MNWWERIAFIAGFFVLLVVVVAGVSYQPEINVNLKDADGKTLCGLIEAQGCTATLLGKGSCATVKLQIVPCEVKA